MPFVFENLHFAFALCARAARYYYSYLIHGCLCLACLEEQFGQACFGDVFLCVWYSMQHLFGMCLCCCLCVVIHAAFSILLYSNHSIPLSLMLDVWTALTAHALFSSGMMSSLLCLPFCNNQWWGAFITCMAAYVYC